MEHQIWKGIREHDSQRPVLLKLTHISVKSFSGLSWSSLRQYVYFFQKGLHELRNIFVKLKHCFSFSMSSIAALWSQLKLSATNVQQRVSEIQRAHREKLEELTADPEKDRETHKDSERCKAFTETHQRKATESGASRSCLDRFLHIFIYIYMYIFFLFLHFFKFYFFLFIF